MTPETVNAFDPTRRTNARLIEDCRQLGYITTDRPTLDLTYGKGAFWRSHPFNNVTANDLDPAKGDLHLDFTRTGLDPASYDAVVFDPPYRLGGTPSTAAFDDAYGLQEYRAPKATRALIEEGTAESVRLSSRIVIVKIQDHVSSGRLQPLSSWVIDAAHGARLVDSLHVVGGRAQPSGRRQVRARHGYSTALVFEVAR